MTPERPDLRADPVRAGEVERDLERLVDPTRYPQEETETETEARVPAPVKDRDDEQVEHRLAQEREELHRDREPRRLLLKHLDERNLKIGHITPERSRFVRSCGIAAAIPLMMNWMAIASTMIAISFGTTRSPPSPMREKIQGP